MAKRKKIIKISLILLSIAVGIGLFLTYQAYCERKVFTVFMERLRGPDDGSRFMSRTLLTGSRDWAVPHLIESIKGEDKNKIDIRFRRDIIWILGAIANKEAIEVVTGYLKHEELAFRYSAVSALTRLNDGRVIEPLRMVVLNDENSGIRKSALLSLRRIDSFNDTETFEKLFNEGRFDDATKLQIRKLIKRFENRDIIKHGKVAM